MKKYFYIVAVAIINYQLSIINSAFAQTTLLQENFTNYMGTSATVPAGWYFSWQGDYTTTSYSGTSGPNSYKFGVTGATIVTPSFAKADSVSFWLKGSSTDTASYLTLYETSDSITWTTLVKIKPIPTSGTTLGHHVDSTAIHLKFVYTKSAGNVAFDDFLLLKKAPLVPTGTIPKPDHVVIVMEENYSYSDIIGNTAEAPYINSLSTDTNSALFVNSYALTHPSQPNYIMLFSGNNQGVTTDNIATNTPFSTCNLGAELLQNSYTFSGYAESLPSTGDTVSISGNYVRKHCPWVNWQGTGTNQISSADHQPFTNYPAGNYSSLPTLCFVIPNLADDMHNPIANPLVAIPAGDTWLKNNMDGYIQWAKTHNSLFILSFDEDDNISSNHITTIFCGPMVKAGQDTMHITHYNVLRTLEDMFGLPACASSSSVLPITNCWNATATGTNEMTNDELQMTIYPNPTSGLFEIQVGNGQSAAGNEYKIEIYNVFGEKVTRSVIPSGARNLTIDLSQAPGGIYFLHIKTEQGIANKKIIINK
ncbi:MAG: T9SS type A sorting domain-containing protein [Bacteroidetes bacterium]|nr:T9SS type A sorting domain-containing protein [Bacteroidota bacterium]